MAIDQTFISPVVPIFSQAQQMQGSIGSMFGLQQQSSRLADLGCDLVEAQVKGVTTQILSQRDLNADQLLASKQARELQALKAEHSMDMEALALVSQSERDRLVLARLKAKGWDV